MIPAMNKEHLHEDPELPPALSHLRHSDPFRVPDGFFVTFPHQVQRAASARDLRRAGRRAAGWAWTWKLALAVLPLLALAAWYSARHTTTPGSEIAGMASQEATLHHEELWTLEQIQDDDLLSLEGSQDLVAAGLMDGLSPEYLETYLEHEDIPIELLIEIL
jgi:hypothetical protein